MQNSGPTVLREVGSVGLSHEVDSKIQTLSRETRVMQSVRSFGWTRALPEISKVFLSISWHLSRKLKDIAILEWNRGGLGPGKVARLCW